MRRQCSLILAIYLARSTEAVYNTSIFSQSNYYPFVWFAVKGADIARLQNYAATLKTDTQQPVAFAQDVVLALARGDRKTAAQAIAYMINANNTYIGGCPNPRPSLAVLAQYGKAFTTAMDMADRQALLWSGLSLQEVAAQLDSPNITAASLAAINASVVADTLLGAMAAAGQSCSQPNTVTPGIQSAVVQKYVNSTCFYVGPVLRAIVTNTTRSLSTFDQTLAAAIKLANVTDRYVTSPVLQAFNRCIDGPASLLDPPGWLGETFASVSIDSSGSSGGVSEGQISDGEVLGGGPDDPGSGGAGDLDGGLVGGGIGEGTISGLAIAESPDPGG